MHIETQLKAVTQFLSCRTPDAWITTAILPENLEIILVDHLICELKAAQTASLLLRKYVLDDASGQHLLEHLAPYENYIYRQEGSLESLKALPSFTKSNLMARNNLAETMFTSPHKQVVTQVDNVDKLAKQLINDMVLLIKEELHHFIQVFDIMHERKITYQNLSAGRYAKRMMQGVRTHEPMTLVDKLICGAFIEARSCERFASLAPYVDDELSRFYLSLLRSESRHFKDYLSLAASLMGETQTNELGEYLTDSIDDRIQFFRQIEQEAILSEDSVLRFHSGVPVSYI
ncbi:tRNA isopentenyl-2-thiomethyl-A-37 hydroxylase MiaE [Thorsellia anophelis]|nr:tRNA isopentenyl-2-thiomethyl-A-37 hydroxylase MiaE [Thorsellia anophelis]